MASNASRRNRKEDVIVLVMIARKAKHVITRRMNGVNKIQPIVDKSESRIMLIVINRVKKIL